MKRYFFGTILIGLGIIGGFTFFLSRRGGIAVKVTPVQEKTLTRSITANGELDSSVKAELTFETTGKVAWLPFRVGEGVKKGQALAALDQNDLKERLFQAEMNLRKARADLDSAAEARRQFHEEHKYDSPSGELFAQFGQYDARVRSSEALVEYYSSLVESTRIALNHATLVAPIDGMIIEINIDEEEVYQATSGPAVVLANLSPKDLYLKVEIDEADLGKIILDQSAEISLDADSKTVFNGTVRETAPRTSLNAAGEKIIEAKIFFDKNLPENLRFLGLSGDAEITLERKKDILVVPLEALFEENEKIYVWGVEKNLAKKVKVETGLESEYEIEIISGLSEDDLIVIEGLDLLKEGQKVKIEKER